MNSFMDQQQEFFKMWNDAVSKSVPGMDAYAKMMPSVQEYWEKAAEFTKSPENVFSNFFKSVPGINAYKNLMPSALPGMDAYADLLKMWKSVENPADFLKAANEQYSDFALNTFKKFLPEGAADMFTKPNDLMKACYDFYESFATPWMEIDPALLEAVKSGDSHAYIAFFREFNEKYEDSFGRLFNMMGLGANREANADYLHMMSAYIKMLFAYAELAAIVGDCCQESSKSLFDKYQEALKEGKAITTFKEFYDFWSGVNEEAFESLFFTDDYARAFGNFSDLYAKYMIASNKVMERQLSNLPIALDSDMRTLYKTVYDLRHDVRDLKKAVEALQEEKKASKTTTSKAAK